MIDVIMSGEVFRVFSGAVSSYAGEAKLHFGEEGLNVRARNPENVAMITVDIPSVSFEAYKVDKSTVIGVDVARLYEISKGVSISKNRKITLVELLSNGNELVVKFGGFEYSISLIDPSTINRAPKELRLSLPARIVLDAGKFRRYLSLVEKINDRVMFKSDSSGLSISAEGDLDTITVHIGENELIDFNRAEAESMFGIDYLIDFIKNFQTGDTLTINLGRNYPVKLIHEAAGGKVRCELVLAPRIVEYER